jgi:predicted LPLAT superfamily acyltransferase
MKAAHAVDDPRRSTGWMAHRERGSILLLRIAAFLSLRLGRRCSRPLLYGIALYFLLFAPDARRASRRYLALALGREARLTDCFRQILSFATTIHDRVFLINRQFHKFEISIEGEKLLAAELKAGRGALLLGAHLGSFEIMRSLGCHEDRLQVTMAIYEDNARKINAVLASVNQDGAADIVPLGRLDTMLKIAERLEQGNFVGLLADRTIGAESVAAVTLLGERAHLPTGPMRAAALLRCPVYFMAGLYRGKNRYHVVIEPIADFSTIEVGSRSVAVRNAIDRYAALLDQYCRSDPYNWFNFFDFWQAPGAPAA